MTRPIGMSGPMPNPMARRRTTGCRSLAASAWHWEGRREQYYLHNFLTSQPDLNFHCDAVQDALLDVARFWLQRGVDGFRLDTINFYFADKYLRDNPSLPPALRNNTIAPSVNPYNHQLHLFDKNQPENLEFPAQIPRRAGPVQRRRRGRSGRCAARA